MRDIEMRIRVQRLLRGEIRIDDLTAIFVYLRNQPACEETVLEIGDLLAHPDVRDRGIVTETVDRYFECLRFHYYLQRNGRHLDLTNAPPEFPRATRTALSKLDERRLRRETGLTRAQAARALKGALTKFVRNSNGSYTLQGKLDARELTIVRFVAGTAVAAPAFDDMRLTREVWSALRRNHLILATERAAFAGLTPALTLLALARMHGTRIVFSNGGAAHLYAWCSQNADLTLQVFALSDHPSPPRVDQQIGLAVPMFLTALRARDWCDPALLAAAGGTVDWWYYPIELSENPLRLKRII